MSRSNYDKPFYVDVGTSIVAIRCASNHDVIAEYDYGLHPPVMQLAKEVCDRMNKEVEIGKPLRNCDVGSVEEQSARWEKLCESYGGQCSKCKFYTSCDLSAKCFAKWAQMPYEGGAK